jgi:predicted RNA-binding Zn ribbon-like protein
VINAALVVALANAQAERRPTGARAAVGQDELADAASASELLTPFLDRPVDPRDLAGVRAVQQAVVAVVDALVGERQPPLQALNALAAQQPAIYTLTQGSDGQLHATPRPQRPSTTGALLLAVMRNLSELEPSRLRRCARSECRLVFYDTSRSATQRWHAERPCGIRARQQRHRTNHVA